MHRERQVVHVRALASANRGARSTFSPTFDLVVPSRSSTRNVIADIFGVHESRQNLIGVATSDDCIGPVHQPIRHVRRMLEEEE